MLKSVIISLKSNGNNSTSLKSDKWMIRSFSLSKSKELNIDKLSFFKFKLSKFWRALSKGVEGVLISALLIYCVVISSLSSFNNLFSIVDLPVITGAFSKPHKSFPILFESIQSPSSVRVNYFI